MRLCILQVFGLCLSMMVALENAAHADFITLSGSLAPEDPIFTRTLAYNDGTQSDFFLGYSSVGNNVFYNLKTFYVTEDDEYTISEDTGAYPPLVLALYQNPFDPSDSSVNYLSDVLSTNVLSYPLQAGTLYDLVLAGQSNGDTPNYTTTISSTVTNGQIVIVQSVPQPGSIVLIATGSIFLAGARFVSRRRSGR